MKKKKRLLTFILGTRPEIIKLSPLIKLCQRQRIPYKIIHSGQHYSYDMDKVFFKDLKLRTPAYSLGIRSKAPYMQGNHTGRMLIHIEEILLKDFPRAVVVHGDTNTALAGALTAEKITTTKGYTGLEINVAHVEAGLRSFDRTMPEEVNRFLVDHLSDFLFAPTKIQERILRKEGVPKNYIHVTGNSIVDAVQQNVKLSHSRRHILKKIGLEQRRYILMTLHRQENVDSKPRLVSILRGIEQVKKKVHLPIVFPMHPRTANSLKKFRLKIHEGTHVIPPVDFLSFLYLESKAGLALTDSGGVQEETCILGVPCVTLRDNTERPETVEVGANIIAGVKPCNIIRASEKMLNATKGWRNPFGDGRASKKMLSVLRSKLDL